MSDEHAMQLSRREALSGLGLALSLPALAACKPDCEEPGTTPTTTETGTPGGTPTGSSTQTEPCDIPEIAYLSGERREELLAQIASNPQFLEVEALFEYEGFRTVPGEVHALAVTLDGAETVEILGFALSPTAPSETANVAYIGVTFRNGDPLVVGYRSSAPFDNPDLAQPIDFLTTWADSTGSDTIALYHTVGDSLIADLGDLLDELGIIVLRALWAFAIHYPCLVAGLAATLAWAETGPGGAVCGILVGILCAIAKEFADLDCEAALRRAGFEV